MPTGLVVASTTPDSLSPLTFTITVLFNAAPYTALGEPFILECEGLQNPKTLETTSSWSMTIFNQDGCGIEKLNTDLTVSMSGVPSFASILVNSEVPNNGLLSTLAFKITSLVTFADDYIIVLTFPPEVRVPDSPECLPYLLTSKVLCEAISEKEIRVRLNFTNPPVTPLQVFGFKLDKFVNQESTKPTGRFTDIWAYNSAG